MRILLAFIFLFTQTTWGQVVNKTAEFNYVWGADYYTNWVLNPSANINLSNTTTSNATLTRDTTTKLNNQASFNLDTSATSGYAEFTLGTVVAPATAGNCQFKGVYLGDASLLSAQVLDGSANVLSSAALQNSGTNWQAFSIYYPCAASGSRKVRITQTTAGTTAAINLGKLYYGQQTDVGAGVPNNVFSAKISAAGVVTEENDDFISGNCSATSSATTCTFVSNKFAITPTCALTANAPSSSSSFAVGEIRSASASSIVYGYGNTVDFAWDTTIICTRAGTDWVQPAIQPPNWDTDWASYTPTISGVGTATNVSFSWSRIGANLYIKGSFTTGTPAASQVQITLPSGLTTSSSITANSVSGYGSSSIAGTNAPRNFYPLLQPSVAYINIGTDYYGSATQSGLSPLNGNTTGSPTNASGINLNFVSGPIAITGWTKTLNAPLLVGSVTSNSTSAFRIETIAFGGSTPYSWSSNCATSPCTIWQQSGAISSVTRSSTGVYVLNWTIAWANPPICTVATGNYSGAGLPGMYISANTTSATTISISAPSTGTPGDGNGYAICMGAR